MKKSITFCLILALFAPFALSQGVIPRVNNFRDLGKGKVSTRVAARVVCRIDSTMSKNEGYRLLIDKRGSHLWAGSQAGLFYGRQTLAQLCCVDSVTCVEIIDSPRYAYRAMMLDPARHFLPIGDLKRYVDVISRYKFNVLHLHLTDDQGFRVEIKAYPRLTEIGALRAQTEGDGRPHGGFYTQKELRDLVEYAAKRHVEIIPEIDIPGHSVAAIAAYPWLTCRDTLLNVRTIPGVSNDLLCAGQERVFGMYDTIISELSSIFPSDRFHIGGDEAPMDHWLTCPRCQMVKQSSGLKSNQELMSYFFDRINASLLKHGKRPLFWFELDVPRYPEGSIMYAWRQGLSARTIDAARKGGYQIICAPGEYAYLDYPQYEGEIKSQSSSWMPILTLEKVYEFDPSYGLSVDKCSHILGVQATIWGEYTPTINDVFDRTFPRALAFAEVAWSEMRVRNWADFYKRAKNEVKYLKSKQINLRTF